MGEPGDTNSFDTRNTNVFTPRETFEMQGLESKEYYPYVTRRIIDLFGEGRLPAVTSIAVEPEYGYVVVLTYVDGSRRVTYGNDLGINAGAACDLAKDKGHSKFVLQRIGVNTPEGESFLLPSWAARVMENPHQAANRNIRTANDADTYIQSNFGYPVYIKPIDGSKGSDVYKVYSQEELSQVVALYEAKKIRVVLVERPVEMPDYRVVMLNGELISAYERIPLTVTGDGSHTIGELTQALQEQYLGEGRDTKITLDDPRINNELSKRGLTLNDMPIEGQKIILLPISNLSAGGTSRDVSKIIDKHWIELAAYIARNFNLGLCGLDLACADITSPTAPYSVIEVNATPGLDHYASSGDEQRRIVDDLYVKVLSAH
jgi:D-alanine-D-alanine ligase-like ATP-grasp enzyme